MADTAPQTTPPDPPQADASGQVIRVPLPAFFDEVYRELKGRFRWLEREDFDRKKKMPLDYEKRLNHEAYPRYHEVLNSTVLHILSQRQDVQEHLKNEFKYDDDQIKMLVTNCLLHDQAENDRMLTQSLNARSEAWAARNANRRTYAGFEKDSDDPEWIEGVSIGEPDGLAEFKQSYRAEILRRATHKMEPLTAPILFKHLLEQELPIEVEYLMANKANYEEALAAQQEKLEAKQAEMQAKLAEMDGKIAEVATQVSEAGAELNAAEAEAAAPKTHYLKDYTPPTHLIDTTDLRFELGEEETVVTSKLKIRKNPAAKTDGHTLVLDGNAEHVKLLEIKIDGRVLAPSEYQLTDKTLTLSNLPAACELEIKTSVQPQNNTELEGLYKSGEGANEKFCTQCEAEGFRNITYYLDRPDVLSKFTTEIIADANKYPNLLSNGNPPETTLLSDGRTSAKWSDPFPKPSYLFALVAGNLDLLEDKFVTKSGRTITLRMYVDKGDLDKTAHAMASIKKAMKWDEERFGREYDLDLFQVVAVHDFNAGAMENKGLNIFNAAYVLANPETATDGTYFNIESTLAHEYFHNYRGNRVPPRDWFQLTLKEGLTVFTDQEFSGDMHSPVTQRIRSVARLRDGQFPEDAGGNAHPVRPESYIAADNLVTETIYQKGAEVVRMMQTLIGKDVFRKGTDLYFERHDGQAVTTEDFVKCMAEVSGKDLSQFERTWYNQAGTPTLAITDEYDAATQTYTLRVKQTTPATPDQPTKEPFHIPLRVGLIDPVSGKDMPLELASNPELLTAGDVLNITQGEQEFVFHNVRKKPIPSLLRNFSAPVKLEYAYSREQLAFLMQHDSDGFNRWEAEQKLAVDILQEMIGQYNAGQPMKPDPLLGKSFRKLLSDPALDKTMVAMCMSLPSEGYLAELTNGPVNPVAIHAASEALAKSLGTSLADELEHTYNANSSTGAYQFTTKDMARRSLKNTAMTYLAAAGNISFAEKQFAAQENMTDVSPSLAALVDSDNAPAREKALAAFYEKWKHDPIVVNRWLAMQAGSEKACSPDQVKALMQHEAFDITNPNNTLSLLGTFAHGNLNFHAADGSGYRFFANEIIAYDKTNQQMAAFLVDPLTQWHMYDEPRATQMRGELQRIVETPDLSKNVFEIVSKSLAFQKRQEVDDSAVDAPKEKQEFEKQSMSAHQYQENEEVFATEIDGSTITVTVNKDIVSLHIGGDESLWEDRRQKLFALLKNLFTSASFEVHLDEMSNKKKAVSFYLRLPNSLDNVAQSVSPSNYVGDIKHTLRELKSVAETDNTGFENAITQLQGEIKIAPNPNRKIPTKEALAKRAKITIPPEKLHDAINHTLISLKDEIGIDSGQAIAIGHEIRLALDDAQRDSPDNGPNNSPIRKIPLAILGKEFRDALREGLREGLMDVDIDVTDAMQSRILSRLFAAVRLELNRLIDHHKA